MAAIEKIDQDITTLKQAIAAIAQETRSLYSNYLTALGQAVRQQLIMTSYHLCTQVYPETFLSLSLNQQQRLQQALQRLSQQAEQQLRSYLQLFFASEDLELNAIELESLSQAPGSLEQAITEELRTASRATNHLLQSYGVLPGTALEILLEVAAKAEDSGSAIPGPPNLLTALIEAKNSSTPEEAAIVSEQPETAPKVTPEANGEPLSSRDIARLVRGETLNNAASSQPTPAAVIAVYLRLDEIEFADSAVMVWRNQIRKFSARLASSLEELEKKQQERTIAEAEAAWRSSWPRS